MNDELQATLTFLQHQNFQVVVVDSYKFDEDYLLALCQAGYWVVLIDDLATMSFPCHDVEAAAMQLGDGRVQLIHSPTSVCDLMLDCDLAISGGGQTLYELAATGTLAVAIKLAENQEKNVACMDGMGMIKRVDLENTSMFADSLVEALRLVMENSNLRREMSIIGRKKVDGLGAKRVASIITSRVRDIEFGRFSN